MNSFDIIEVKWGTNVVIDVPFEGKEREIAQALSGQLATKDGMSRLMIVAAGKYRRGDIWQPKQRGVPLNAGELATALERLHAARGAQPGGRKFTVEFWRILAEGIVNDWTDQGGANPRYHAIRVLQPLSADTPVRIEAFIHLITDTLIYACSPMMPPDHLPEPERSILFGLSKGTRGFSIGYTPKGESPSR